MFDQAGAKVPLSALKPGQVITATINTTEPLIEHVEEVNAVTVVKVVDRHLTVQLADGRTTGTSSRRATGSMSTARASPCFSSSPA